MFDELKILITGDTTGIESAVKKALNIVQGGVEKMNDQTVDWTAIFSRAVSPAIISGVASVFAFAIAQSVQFQQAMNTTGTAAGDSASQLQQMSQQALALSTTLPNSASQLAGSLTQISALFGTNTRATQDITQAIAQLSSSGFGDLTDITKSAMDLFRQFGVTTEAGAVQVLTDLMHAAEGAKETIPQLADQFSTFSGQIPQADRSISSFTGLISTFAAEIAQLGATGATAIFSSLATSANNLAGPMELMGVSFKDIQTALQSGNIVGVLGQVSTKMEQMGPSAFLVAQGFGFSQQQVAAFQTSSTRLPQIAADTKTIATNAQSIGDAFQQSDSAMREFMTDWNKLSALFTSGPLADAIEGIAKLFGGVVDIISKTGGVLSGIATNPIGFLGLNPDDIVNLFTGGSKPNNTALQKQLGGVGGNTGADFLSRLDQTAGSQAMIDSLVSALQSGIKGNQYASLVNTFHLNVPAGATGLTAKQIADQLYQQFQGTK